MRKKSKLKKVTPLIMGTCMLTFLAACGSSDDDNGRVTQQEEQQQEGNYRVVLTPVNPSVSGQIAASANFAITSDEFRAMVDVQNAPDAIHLQHVHIGTSCPTETADTNGDGFVDVVEATANAGGILIPLDNDLSAQSAGGNYPSGTTYKYEETTSYLAMLGDLRLPDPDEQDAVVKLGQTEELNLAGKVVMIHGVPDSVDLPETVQGLGQGNMDSRKALPIACGVIERVLGEGQDDTQTSPGEEGDPTADDVQI